MLVRGGEWWFSVFGGQLPGNVDVCEVRDGMKGDIGKIYT